MLLVVNELFRMLKYPVVVPVDLFTESALWAFLDPFLFEVYSVLIPFENLILVVKFVELLSRFLYLETENLFPDLYLRSTTL